MRLTALLLASACFLLSAIPSEAQIFHKRKKTNKSTSTDNTAEPDKMLYNRAVEDIKHGRHEVGRLTLQTLINTYPDSEYLAKAKLKIADSFFKEGGTANMTQAIQSYKDFIVFFPFLPEAAYAQHQVAMAHYKQMDKPDRDRTQARAAEDEFQTFLQKYPNDPLVPSAEQHLREVQEVLAEGDYRIGYFYYVKGDRRAAAGRLLSLTSRYPLYSRSDKALWMLGDIFEKSEQKEMAGRFYARIVRDYPLSSFGPDAKSRLTELKAPIPQPDPKAVAWMQAEQNAPRPKNSLVKKPLGLLRTGPGGELRAAARTGSPTLTPEAEAAGTDILAGGNQSRIGGAPGNSVVATVAPGSSDTSTAAGTAESTAAPAEGTSNPAATPPASDAGSTTSSSTDPAAASGSTAAPSDPNADPAKAADSKPADGQAQNGGTGQDGKNQDPNAKQKESSSKKKKGLRKIVPW